MLDIDFSNKFKKAAYGHLVPRCTCTFSCPRTALDCMGWCLIAQSQMPRQGRKRPCHGICADVACLSRFLLDLCHPDLSCKDCPLACCPGSVLTALEACSCLQATRPQLKFGCPDCPTLPTSVQIPAIRHHSTNRQASSRDRYDRWRFADDLQGPLRLLDRLAMPVRFLQAVRTQFVH